MGDWRGFFGSFPIAIKSRLPSEPGEDLMKFVFLLEFHYYKKGILIRVYSKKNLLLWKPIDWLTITNSSIFNRRTVCSLSCFYFTRAQPDTFAVPFENILLIPPFPYDAKKKYHHCNYFLYWRWLKYIVTCIHFWIFQRKFNHIHRLFCIPRLPIALTFCTHFNQIAINKWKISITISSSTTIKSNKIETGSITLPLYQLQRNINIHRE